MEPLSGTFSDRLTEFARRHSLAHEGDSLLLAVSGGIDSMVMLHVFTSLKDAWNLSLCVIHLNHQLRGNESDRDEEFVRDAARAAGVPFFCNRVDTAGHAKEHHLGKQEAARRLRYEFFDDIRRETNATSIATAHNANDNAETVLMNALRGAGIRGLSGIPYRRNDHQVVRPLLFAYRSEIEVYASLHEIAHCEDSSNESLEYRRNLLRREILPRMEGAGFPDIHRSLNRLSEMMRAVDAQVQGRIAIERSNIVKTDRRGHQSIELTPFSLLEPFLRDELILSVLRDLRIEPSVDRIERILELIRHPAGHRIDLTKQWSVYRDRDSLLFTPPIDEQGFSFPVKLDEEYSFADFHIGLKTRENVQSPFGRDRSIEFIDATRLRGELIVRNWRPGDWFMPLGMNAKKKLSDFFTDEKISLLEKRTIPILEADGQIAWVCGYRIDERFKITPRTESVVQLTYHQLNHPNNK